jgi:hypothetical protein
MSCDFGRCPIGGTTPRDLLVVCLFYTHKTLDFDAVNRMELSDDEYRGLGISIMARLVALMKESK